MCVRVCGVCACACGIDLCGVTEMHPTSVSREQTCNINGKSETSIETARIHFSVKSLLIELSAQ